MSNNKVIWNQKATDDLMKKLGDKLDLVGELVRSSAVNNITDMGAVDTGRLKNSITYETDKKELVTRVGSNVEYAPFIELGFLNKAPRPFLRLALYENVNKIKEILKR